MAKRKTDMPSVESPTTDTPTPQIEQGFTGEVITVEFPVPKSLTRVRDYIGVNARPLTKQQKRGLQLLMSFLHEAEETLANGKRCYSAQDAVKWLLEQCAK